MAPEWLIRTLYFFFALEALLGDKAEGLKGYGLAFRRTILSHAVSGSFPNPGLVYYLYDEVRSAAVHGSATPQISRNALASFDHSVRLALNEYLAFAEQRSFTKRAQVLDALDTHPDASATLRWLRQLDPRWNEFEPHRAAASRAPSSPEYGVVDGEVGDAEHD